MANILNKKNEYREFDQVVVYEVYPINLYNKIFSIMTHKEIENELGYWGDIIRENPDRYAYVRQHFSNILRRMIFITTMKIMR